MIFTLTDRKYNPMDAYDTDDYLIGKYVGSVIKTLDIDVLVGSENSQHWQQGNYIMCSDADGYNYWFTIYDVSDSLKSDVKTLHCYSGTIDVVAEDATPIGRPSQPQPFTYYFDRIFYDTGIVMGVNELEGLTRTLEFTSETISNAQMLQYVLNAFDGAEADLEVEFDGSVPTRVVLNVFKRIGSIEPQTVLSDQDDSLISLDRTGSITGLATCLNPVGQNPDNLDIPLTLVGKYYEEKDEDGDILYYSPVDSPRVFSPQAKEKFFVELPGKATTEFEGYINRRYSSEAETKDALWRESVEQLKKIDHPSVTYDAKGYIDCNIGDTIQILSNEMQPPIMISARVMEYKFNDDVPSKNEYVFGNYEELESNLDELSKLMAEIKKAIIFVKSVETHYTISDQGDIPPTTGWTDTVVTANPGQWSWIRTSTILSNGDITYGYSVSYSGVDGAVGIPGPAGKDGVNGSDGATGPAGQNAITGYLTNESLIVPSNNAGTVSSWAGANGYFRVMDGISQATSGMVFSLVSSSGCTTTINSAGYYSVTAMSGDFGTATYRAVYKGTTIDKIMMIVKNKQGDPGTNGSNGSTGPAGNGISSAAVTYQASSSGTVAPTGTWTTAVPSVAANQFLWTRTITTYTSGGTTTAYSVGKMGANGTNGTNGATGPAGPPTGIIEAATAPTTDKYVGMLWRNTADGITRRWNGSAWTIFMLHAENLSATNLAAITANLGIVTAGKITGEGPKGSMIIETSTGTISTFNSVVLGGQTYVSSIDIIGGMLVTKQTHTGGTLYDEALLDGGSLNIGTYTALGSLITEMMLTPEGFSNYRPGVGRNVSFTSEGMTLSPATENTVKNSMNSGVELQGVITYIDFHTAINPTVDYGARIVLGHPSYGVDKLVLLNEFDDIVVQTLGHLYVKNPTGKTYRSVYATSLVAQSAHSIKKDFRDITTDELLQAVLETDIVGYHFKEEDEGDKEMIGFVINDDGESPYKTADILVGKDGQSFNSSTLFGVIMGAIKEMNKKIETLEAWL